MELFASLIDFTTAIYSKKMDYLNASLSTAIVALSALQYFMDIGVLFIIGPFVVQMIFTLLHCQQN